MIIIDSQLWIFYLDPLSKENPHVVLWFDGSQKSGILKTEEIGLSAIFPLEVAHTLYKIPHLNQELSEKMLLSLISIKNIQILELDQFIMLNALNHLRNFGNKGIGGRDAIIISTMDLHQINTIATHDKGILRLNHLRRIDPVFDPPMILEPGEIFDENVFAKRMCEFDSILPTL